MRVHKDLKLEIVYFEFGSEGFELNTNIGIGWALRRWYLMVHLRLRTPWRPYLYRNFAIGWNREQKRLIWGINR